MTNQVPMTDPRHIEAYKYYKKGLQRKDIAKIFAVSESTISAWCAKYSWVLMRDGDYPELHIIDADIITDTPSSQHTQQGALTTVEPIDVDDDDHEDAHARRRRERQEAADARKAKYDALRDELHDELQSKGLTGVKYRVMVDNIIKLHQHQDEFEDDINSNGVMLEFTNDKTGDVWTKKNPALDGLLQVQKQIQATLDKMLMSAKHHTPVDDDDDL